MQLVQSNLLPLLLETSDLSYPKTDKRYCTSEIDKTLIAQHKQAFLDGDVSAVNEAADEISRILAL